jgi:hypothetical protein
MTRQMFAPSNEKKNNLSFLRYNVPLNVGKHLVMGTV